MPGGDDLDFDQVICKVTVHKTCAPLFLSFAVCSLKRSVFFEVNFFPVFAHSAEPGMGELLGTRLLVKSTQEKF